MEQPNEFVRTIQEARMTAGLTQRDLTRRMKWKSDSYVSMIETGQRGVSLDEVPRLASVLGLDARSLVGLYFEVYFPTIYRILIGREKAKARKDRRGPMDDLASRIDRLPPEAHSILEALVDLLHRSTPTPRP